MKQVRLRVFRTALFKQGVCGVCGGEVIAQHFDSDLQSIVGACCNKHLMSAEIVLLANDIAQPAMGRKGTR